MNSCEVYTLKKKCAYLLLAFLLSFTAYKIIHAYDRRNDGFAIEKIHSHLPYDPRWNVEVSEEQIHTTNHILEQPFHYLGRGFQCYAFISADGKYVLKFFRHQRMRLPPSCEYLPNVAFIKDFKARKAADFEKRKNYLFTGIKVGFEAAPHETALIFVHLNKTKNQHGKTVIFDKLGNQYVVDMNQVEFMLQHKAVHIKPTISQLMTDDQEEEAKKRLKQIFTLLVTCAKNGIQDTDGALIRKNNLGFLEDRAIYIDSGKLARKEEIKNKERFVKDLHRLKPLYRWLKDEHPELARCFKEYQQQAINEF